MKHFLTVTALLISSLAMGQWPSLPYNPDDNADGLIGVADLQTLLSNYGNEFSSAVVSEDGESAIVYMGEMAFPPCALACRSLPGMWETASTVDLGLVWNEVYSTGIDNLTWLKPSSGSNVPGLFVSQDESSYIYHETLSEYKYMARQARCYCAAKQLPRVEYSHCSGGAPSEEAFNQCINEKLAEGWYPLSGFPSDFTSDGYGNFIGGGTQDKRVLPEKQSHASFWRWAE